MYTKADIPLELEQKIKENNSRLLGAVKPRRGEMRILASMRAEEVMREYEAIIRNLPITLDEKISFRSGGGDVYLFKGDDLNARTLIEIAFGHGVARGAYSIYPLEQRDDFETLEREAFRIQPAYNNRDIIAFMIPGCIPIITPPADLSGTTGVYVLSPDFPPRISVNALHEYGKFLGYRLNVDYVKSVFEKIKSLELPSSGVKETWLTVKMDEQPKQEPIATAPLPQITHHRPYARYARRTDITEEVLRGLIARKMSIEEMAKSLDTPYQTVYYRLFKLGLRDNYRQSRV